MPAPQAERKAQDRIPVLLLGIESGVCDWQMRSAGELRKDDDAVHPQGHPMTDQEEKMDKLKPLPGPSDDIILKEIKRHMALCGSEFPDCGIGHAMRYIFAQEAARRPDNGERAVVEAAREYRQAIKDHARDSCQCETIECHGDCGPKLAARLIFALAALTEQEKGR